MTNLVNGIIATKFVGEVVFFVGLFVILMSANAMPKSGERGLTGFLLGLIAIGFIDCCIGTILMGRVPIYA